MKATDLRVENPTSLRLCLSSYEEPLAIPRLTPGSVTFAGRAVRSLPCAFGGRREQWTRIVRCRSGDRLARNFFAWASPIITLSCPDPLAEFWRSGGPVPFATASAHIIRRVGCQASAFGACLGGRSVHLTQLPQAYTPESFAGVCC